MYDYKCAVIRVVDGDTVEINIDLGFDVWYRSPARLMGINAPEMHGATKVAGTASKIHLESLLASGNVTVLTHGRDKDKYGRVLCTFMVNGNNVNQTMVTEGFAVPYMV